jgi:endonuclease YncB( thermonuclease family)
MARPYFLFRSVVAGLVLAAALCPLQVAPGAERPERQYTRDPIRTYRPRTPAEFFNQDAVRFERVRIEMSGLIYADDHSLSLYGAVLIPRNKICNPPDGVRWACGQRAFMALRNLLERKSIACTFKHVAGPLKAACSVGDDDVAQVLLTQGWAGSEPRIPNAAAQTRIVSGGAFWPSQGELSRHLKYIARARIPEFESHHLSQAVWSDRRHSEWRVVEVHPWAANEFEDAD